MSDAPADPASFAAVADWLGDSLDVIVPVHALRTGRCAVWFDWSSRLPIGLPPRLVSWIEDEVQIGSVEVLRRACRLWDRVRSDRQRGVSALDTTPHRVGLPERGYWSYGENAARPVNLPAERISVPAGILLHPTSSLSAAAQLRHTTGHRNAQPSAAASTIRAWRGK